MSPVHADIIAYLRTERGLTFTTDDYGFTSANLSVWKLQRVVGDILQCAMLEMDNSNLVYAPLCRNVCQRALTFLQLQGASAADVLSTHVETLRCILIAADTLGRNGVLDYSGRCTIDMALTEVIGKMTDVVGLYSEETTDAM